MAQTPAVVADMLGLSVCTRSFSGRRWGSRRGNCHPLGFEAVGEQMWEQWAARVGCELELIAGIHPGEAVAVVCHQASVLAAAQYFLEATYSRAHASVEVDRTAITEWQLCPLDREASGKWAAVGVAGARTMPKT
ncbi:histidine phosphatase family protein [Nocardia sp. NPDC051929]|uniref:histidine phosphatase family protein n=1 Tax=unclassified Nocardia TaxID=2637762 RepID=UPI0034421E46